LRQWGLRFAAYQSENDGRFPTAFDHQRFAYDGGETIDFDYFFAHWIWEADVRDTMSPRKIMLCPVATQPPPVTSQFFQYFPGATFGAWDGGAKTLGIQDSARRLLSYLGSYAVNARLAHAGAGKVKPAAMPTLFDCRTARCFLRDAVTDEPPAYEEMMLGCNDCSYYAAPMTIDRHQQAVNVLFLDGAVRKTGLKELWTLKWHQDFETHGPWTQAGGAQPADWPLWMRGFRDH
jgi:prepilin-type processing-associated H-X9-DG protein